MSSPSTESVSNYTNDDGNGFLPRSASYTDLPRVLPATEPGPSNLRRTFSDYAVPTLSGSPTKESVAAGKDILRRTSLRSKNRPEIAVSHFTLSSSEEVNKTSTDLHASKTPRTTAPEPVARPSKGRSMSGRIVSLARKPWGSSSRSPSPSSKRAKQHQNRGDEQSSISSRSQTKKTATATETLADSESVQPTRKRTILYKRPRRPMLAVVAKGLEDSPGAPNSPTGRSLRQHSSLEKFTSSLSVSTPVLPPMPKGAAATAAAALSHSGGDYSRRKDELWGVFRGLEADYQKYVPTILRA